MVKQTDKHCVGEGDDDAVPPSPKSTVRDAGGRVQVATSTRCCCFSPSTGRRARNPGVLRRRAILPGPFVAGQTFVSPATEA